MGNPHEIPIKNTWNWLDGAVFDLASPWTQRFAQDARSAVRTAKRRRARSVWSFGGGKRGSRPESRVPLAQGDLFPFFLFGYKLYQVISIKESPVLSLESSYLPKIYLTRWCPAVFAGFEATELWFQIPKP